MIDTVILTIPKAKVRKPYHEEWGVGWELQSQSVGYKKYVRNATKAEKEAGTYVPRLTLIYRGANEANVKIEFSVPKLLWGNNVDEVSNKDFATVVTTLRERLATMNLDLNWSDIANAQVQGVHFCKNIFLQDGYTAQYVISELAKINSRRTLDATKCRYMNDGQSFCIYSNTHSFIAYDKVADLNRDPKRAIDKDQTPLQQSLFDALKPTTTEIVRFEARFPKQRSVNEMMEKIGYKPSPTFQTVFKSTISAKALAWYWDKYVAPYSLTLFSPALGPKELFTDIIRSAPKTKPKEAIFETGLLILCRDEDGIRQLRAMFGRRMQDRSWYRITANLKGLQGRLAKTGKREWFTMVEQELKKPAYKRYSSGSGFNWKPAEKGYTPRKNKR